MSQSQSHNTTRLLSGISHWCGPKSGKIFHVWSSSLQRVLKDGRIHGTVQRSFLLEACGSPALSKDAFNLSPICSRAGRVFCMRDTTTCCVGDQTTSAGVTPFWSQNLTLKTSLFNLLRTCTEFSCFSHLMIYTVLGNKIYSLKSHEKILFSVLKKCQQVK